MTLASRWIHITTHTCLLISSPSLPFNSQAGAVWDGAQSSSSPLRGCLSMPLITDFPSTLSFIAAFVIEYFFPLYKWRDGAHHPWWLIVIIIYAFSVSSYSRYYFMLLCHPPAWLYWYFAMLRKSAISTDNAAWYLHVAPHTFDAAARADIFDIVYAMLDYYFHADQMLILLCRLIEMVTSARHLPLIDCLRLCHDHCHFRCFFFPSLGGQR